MQLINARRDAPKNTSQKSAATRAPVMDEELVACLSATLSSERTEREAAATRLEQGAYPTHDAAGALGVHLARIFAAEAAPVAVRQAAGTALKRYILERWSVFFEPFLRQATAAGASGDGEALPLDAKHVIRTLLLAALGDAQRKVRLLAAQLLSIVSSAEFPDQFPELLPHIRAALAGNGDQVHGALKFLSDFAQEDVDESQLLVIARDFVPLLQGVMGNSAHSAHTHARCMLVFRQCLTSLYIVRDTYTSTVREALAVYLPPWLEAMDAMLAAPLPSDADAAAWETFGLRREIFRTLSAAARFPKLFAEWRVPLLRRTLEVLEAGAPLFVRAELLGFEHPAALVAPEPREDDADVAAGVSGMALSALSFVTEALRAPVDRSLGELAADPRDAALRVLRAACVYAQITREDEEEWDADPDAFVAEDDEENVAVTLRTVSTDLCEHLLEGAPHAAVAAAARLADETPRDAGAGSAWWKRGEALLLLLGACHETLEGALDELEEDGGAPLSVRGLFAALVLPLLGETPPYLRGRCFVCASQFAGALDDALVRSVFAAALDATRSADAPLPLQLSAVRTLRNVGNLRPEVAAPAAREVVLQLGPLLLRAAGGTLVLVADALSAALEHGEVDAATQEQVVHAAMEAWRTHAADPEVGMSVGYLLETLVRGKHAETVLPAACTAVAAALNSETEDLAVQLGAASLARTVLSAARGAELRGVAPGMFQAVVALLLRTGDAEVAQNLIHCLTLVCQKSPDEVLAWRDAHGATALEALLRVVEHQFALGDDEACGMPLGVLLVTLFVQAGEALSPVMPALLHALARKLVASRSSACTLAMLFPMAYLFAQHTSAVVQLLADAQVQGADGPENALRAVVRTWLAEMEHVHSWFVRNVHILGITHLFDQWPAQLDTLLVNGEVLPLDTDLIITRSRAKALPTRHAQIPAAAKVLKQAVHEWEQAAPRHDGAARAAAENAELDDGDAEWDDEETDAQRSLYYQDLFDAAALAGEDDEEAAGAPEVDLPGCEAIKQLDVRGYLETFFRRYAQAAELPRVQTALQHLEPRERELLAEIVR